MNWLAKINLALVISRLGAFKSAILILAVISLCLFTGYRLGNYFHDYQVTRIKQQQDRLVKLYAEQAKQVERIHRLEVELAVEQLANQKAQKILKNTAKEHYQVKTELAFYEKVMAPEKQAGGIVIESMKIFPTKSASHYRFQVALVQQQLKRHPTKGDIELIIAGSLANKPSQLKLQDISELNQKELRFKFKYFQMMSGEFSLPKEFVAEELKLSVSLAQSSGQKYVKLSKSYPWRLEVE